MLNIRLNTFIVQASIMTVIYNHKNIFIVQATDLIMTASILL